MTQWQGTVLVTGATGALGRRIVANLTKRGIAVRALIRRPAQADDMRRLGAEPVIGDLTQRETLVSAVEGISGIISAAGATMGKGESSPEAVDFQGNSALIDLAVQAGVRHFVMLSVMGAQYIRSASLFSAKFHAEQYLRQSGLRWTILRGGAFMPTYAEAATRGANKGLYNVIGKSSKPVYFISPDDLAELAVRSLWEPEARAKTFDVTNATPLNAHAIAAIHQRVYQRPIRLRRLPTILLKAARIPLRYINASAADFVGFLQAVGDEVFKGRPDLIQAAFPDFTFEEYEAFLLKTRSA